MGPCRVCRDVTVLPGFGDGRCFGCTTDEIGETQWELQPQILLHESEMLLVHQEEILEIFDEAQRSVPAYKVVLGKPVADGAIHIRRHGLWLPRNRRWAHVQRPSERMKAGFSTRHAINSYYRDLRKAHHALGLCIHCTEPAVTGQTLCGKHRSRTQRTYLDRKAAGVCLGCAGPRDTDAGTCSACIAKRTRSQALRAERLSEAGLCTACGERPAAPRWCVECTEKKNAARRNKRESEIK